MKYPEKINFKRAFEILQEYKNSHFKFQSIDYKDLLKLNIPLDPSKTNYVRFYYGLRSNQAGQKSLK